jgi:hypothetical protein
LAEMAPVPIKFYYHTNLPAADAYVAQAQIVFVPGFCDGRNVAPGEHSIFGVGHRSRRYAGRLYDTEGKFLSHYVGFPPKCSGLDGSIMVGHNDSGFLLFCFR